MVRYCEQNDLFYLILLVHNSPLADSNTQIILRVLRIAVPVLLKVKELLVTLLMVNCLLELMLLVLGIFKEVGDSSLGDKAASVELERVEQAEGVVVVLLLNHRHSCRVSKGLFLLNHGSRGEQVGREPPAREMGIGPVGQTPGVRTSRACLG